MPKLVRNKKGIYEIRYSELIAGRQRSKAVSTRSSRLSDAKIVYDGWLKAQAHAMTPKGLSLFGLIAAYKSVLTGNQVSPTQMICLEHLERTLGDLEIGEITPMKINSYKQARGVADGTLRRELGALKAVLNFALKHRLIQPNDMPMFDLPRQSQPKNTFLKDEEEIDFYQRALDHTPLGSRLTRVSRFVALALDTAARKDAILSLTWDRVDLVAGTIDYREPGLQLHNKRRALVPISLRLRPIIERAHRERVSAYVLDTPNCIRREWERWVATTPYGHITPHDLRRTFATLAVQAGVPIVNVAAILGDSIEIVMRHYACYVPSNAAAAVNARFGKGEGHNI